MREWFSFECRKVIGFAITTLRDWLKKLAPLFHPIRSKTKTNRKSLALVFPRFASATCNHFKIWLVHCIVCVFCDWLEWLLWVWFYDTQLKTALIGKSKRSDWSGFCHSLSVTLLTCIARSQWGIFRPGMLFALDRSCTDLAVLGSHCHDLGPDIPQQEVNRINLFLLTELSPN